MTRPFSSSVLHRELPQWVDPARAFTAMYGTSTYAFWLDGGAHAESGDSYMGEPAVGARVVTASVRDASLSIATVAPDGALAPDAQKVASSVFDFLRGELAPSAKAASDAMHESSHALPRFRLGWVGWLGYELGAATVGTPAHHARTPDAAVLEIDRCLAFDHARKTVSLVMRSTGDAASDATELNLWHVQVLAALSAAADPAVAAHPAGPAETPSSAETPDPADAGSAPQHAAPHASGTRPTVDWRHRPERYTELIAQCQAAIHRGDAYQLCLTNEIRVGFAPHEHPDPLDTYLRLRASSPTHHGGFVRVGDVSLLSASPEQFLAVTAGGHVTTKPIKGTRRRASGLARDLELRAELESSAKERAENLMIVDLMRNDLGKISTLGSVSVSKLLSVESYAHVHQLVSTIESQLAHGLSAVDAVQACFPAGSMTGAPKISAMATLHELEQGPRGIYSGVFGYFGLDGAADLAMVIRSIVLDVTGASIGTGGGITALSIAAEEIEETQIKAAALLAVLGVGGPLDAF